MKVPQSTCSRAAIEQFLADRLSGPELSAFEDHLENCPPCRESLDNLAADSQWWDRARLYLSAAQDGVVSISNQHHETANETEQTLFGLKNYLAPTDDPRMLGRLGTYEIVGIIGCGGMGIVLKAFDGPLNRTVAIKVLGPHLALNPVSRQRFAREAKAAATVVNLNVIAIHSVAEANGLPYFVMPYVRGPSLEKRLRDGNAFSVVEILRIGMQIASGLAAAHAQGVVHRDIKPANIMLEEGIERVTITDFGLARVADDASMTQSGVVAGTPQYMSPEQARGDAVDPRSDLFSLGSVLYALCTGQPPFQSSTTMGVLKRVEECRPRPIRALNPEIPELLVRIVERLHAKEPTERFQSAAEVAVLLEGYLAHLGQPETVPVPEMAAVAKKTGRKMVGRLVSFTPSLLVLIALGFGGGAWIAGCGGGRAPDKDVAKSTSNELPTLFHHDFRGQPLPPELLLYNAQEGKVSPVVEPEGLRIKVAKPFLPHWSGVGLKTMFGLKGDFEFTAAFELLEVDKPASGSSCGVALYLATADENFQLPTALDRYFDSESEGVRWWATDRSRKGSAPCSDKIFRLALKRTGSTLRYLWAPGTQGDAFQEIGQADWSYDIGYFRVTVFVEKRPINLDVRLLDMRIRSHEESTPGVIVTKRRGLTAALLIGMLITLTLALVLWLFIWRQRRSNAIANISEKSPAE